MSGGIHCYPGTEVLKNKYNIRDKELLEKLEIQKVAAKILGLDIKPDRVKCTCDITHLINIYLKICMNGQEHSGEKISIKVKGYCPEAPLNMQIIRK